MTTFARLRRLNVAAAILHLGQAIAVAALANDFALPVTGFYWNDVPSGELDPSRLVREFDIPIAWGVFAFLFLSFFFHALVSFGPGRRVYEAEVTKEQNRFRWAEYSLSATLMLVLIAMYSGITDAAALLCLVGANVGMILFGWIQEMVNPPDRTTTTMKPFWFGTIAGLLPWAAIWVQVVGADTVPGFVMVLIVVEQVFFFSFGLNQWLQYRRVGKWASYAYGERVYLVLSLVAKSLLAWQIFGNTLAV